MHHPDRTPPAITRTDSGPAPEGVRPHSELRVELFTAAPGVIELEPSPDHRVIVHAGSPVQGTCSMHRFTYTRGDVDLFPAGLGDAWQANAAVATVTLHLAPSLLRRAAADLGLDPDRAGLEPRHQFRDPQIEHLAWALDAERRSGYPNGRLYTDCLGIALAAHLLGSQHAPARLPRGLSKPQLRRLMEYIDAHLDQNLSLERLAAVADVSPSHLKTLFRRSTGFPVHQYVVQRRVERARRLLLQDELSASQVALEAGFSHQSHMARCMRRVLGVTPGAVARSLGAAGSALVENEVP